eukprot:10406675-Lingulodinium_polyedra.AAC.1
MTAAMGATMRPAPLSPRTTEATGRSLLPMSPRVSLEPETDQWNARPNTCRSRIRRRRRSQLTAREA